MQDLRSSVISENGILVVMKSTIKMSIFRMVKVLVFRMAKGYARKGLFIWVCVMRKDGYQTTQDGGIPIRTVRTELKNRFAQTVV